jgi:hypothetical protein
VPDRPLPAAAVGRRTAVLGLAATVLLTGCDHGDDLGQPTGTPVPSTTSPSPSAPPTTPDERLVDQVTTELNSAMGVLIAVRRAPGLRAVLAPLVRAHRQHLEVLEREPTSHDPGSATPLELSSVLGSERRLQAALVAAAEQAESGALAALLASISASVTQHLAALPRKA